MPQATDDRRVFRNGERLRQMISARQQRIDRSNNSRRRSPSTYEAVTRQMVESLTAELRDVKSRVNQLLSVIVGAIVLEVLTRLISG